MDIYGVCEVEYLVEGALRMSAKVKYVDREIFDQKILASLNDKEKVAILCTKEDCDLLIKALQLFPIGFPIDGWYGKAKEMADDITKLRKLSFQ